MAKLIGTGKDPRFPVGQDYDVNDADLQHHIDAGLGEPVEPGAEAYAVHRGYDTIAEDPGEQTGAGGPVVQENYGFASRTASRVETTSGPGGEAASAEDAVAAAREGAVDEGPGGGAALPHRGTDPVETESEDQAELREERAQADDGDAEDGPLPGEGGRGAEAARLADADLDEARETGTSEPGNAEEHPAAE